MDTRTQATRMERDIVGELAVPADAYYGVHTLRAMQNFPITGQPLQPEMIRALFEGRADPLTLRFLLFLDAKKRVGALPAVAESFGAMFDAHSGILDAQIVSATPLAPNQFADIGPAVLVQGDADRLRAVPQDQRDEFAR